MRRRLRTRFAYVYSIAPVVGPILKGDKPTWNPSLGSPLGPFPHGDPLRLWVRCSGPLN